MCVLARSSALADECRRELVALRARAPHLRLATRKLPYVIDLMGTFSAGELESVACIVPGCSPSAPSFPAPGEELALDVERY